MHGAVEHSLVLSEDIWLPECRWLLTSLDRRSEIVRVPIVIAELEGEKGIIALSTKPISMVRTTTRDDRILAEFGLPPGPHPSYEADHLIPLDLGGADVDANLWTEPRRSIEPVWNAERKDRLEWRMADMVCGGQLGLATAQKAIRDNWVDASRT